jgi:type II secretory pathway component PulK
MIISEDNAVFDDLTEVWAVPIAPIRMTDVAGAQEAYFSGRLMDAQAAFNLRNIRPDGTPAQNGVHLAWARSLMLSAGLTEQQSMAWIAQILAASASELAAARAFDVLPAGVPETVQRNLEVMFTFLPERTLININTVQQDVLAAHPSIGAAQAQQLIATRNRAAIRDPANIANALGISPALAQQFDVKTKYFVATGRLAVGRIDVMARSLMQRQGGGPPRLLWSMPL